MELGLFSISLTVADLEASRDFYEKLGFTQTGGAMEQNYLIMVNGTTVIGLFRGMFEKNILTFNPGLSLDGSALESFADVRDLQAALREQGIEFAVEADESSDGPASFMVEDPDGNPILVDQFSGRP